MKQERHNPFDPDNYPALGIPVVLPDLDRPGYWTARFAGTLEPQGCGPDPYKALTDLDQRSDQRDKREHGASGNLYAPVEMIVHKGAAQGVSLAFKRRCEGAQGWSRIAKLGQV